jgi:RHS repeat-associated protein
VRQAREENAAGRRPIAMRVMPPNDATGTLYYLHSDHLGSTSVTTCGSGACGAAGAVVARQWYYPYGEIRPGGTGTTPTTIGYTGQRREEAGLGSLMYYRARFYSPLLQRFLSADTIVPSAGNPQALNRYAYVYGSPLKYIDPSGHDVMFIGGWWSNAYDDPAAFEMWVRAYKGWDASQWASFYRAWMSGTDTILSQIMNTTGVHFFNYDMGAEMGSEYGYWSGNAINSAMIQALSKQMAGMKDITLVGYSKGGSLVMSYLAALEGHPGLGLTEVSKAAIIKPAYGSPSQFLAEAPEPGHPFERSSYCIAQIGCIDQRSYSGPVSLVNIHSSYFDWVTQARSISGAYNITDDSQQTGMWFPTNHGNAPDKAIQAFSALDVGNDSNSGLNHLVR